MPTQRTLQLCRQYQTLAEDLLSCVERNHFQFKTPAEALQPLLWLLGWRLEFPVLPEDRWAECDQVSRTIRVTKDLPQRLSHANQARLVAHACIAHELGHAVLHGGPRQSRNVPKSWEFEARIFSQVFLCPWKQLADRVEIRQLRTNCLTMRQRWARINDLAADFRVTPSFMTSTLVLYGVIERTKGGVQATPGILCTPARQLRYSSAA